MLIAGLTGSIGMGKSTLAAHLRERGIAVFDADAEVHRLYSGAAAPLIEAAFPGTTTAGEVDRLKLSGLLANDPAGFGRLEAIVHPLVRQAEREFLHREHVKGANIAGLEIPLLIETGGEKLVDVVILASAAEDVRRARVLQRPGMTSEKLDLIIARQGNEAGKRAKADFVVDTGTNLPESLAVLDAIVDKLRMRQGTAFARFWA